MARKRLFSEFARIHRDVLPLSKPSGLTLFYATTFAARNRLPYGGKPLPLITAYLLKIATQGRGFPHCAWVALRSPLEGSSVSKPEDGSSTE